MKIISRKEAKAAGLTRFFTSLPCRKGHIAEWHVGGGCVTCNSERKKQWKIENRERVQCADRNWRANNVLRRRENERKHRAKNPEYYRRKEWRAWGYPEPTRPTPDLCECCGNPQTHKAMCLDHCHVTNKFRGWLCDGCNTSIGKLGDNLEGLQRAIEYLKRAE